MTSLLVCYSWVIKSRDKFHPNQLLVYLRELLVEVPAYYDLGLFVLS